MFWKGVSLGYQIIEGFSNDDGDGNEDGKKAGSLA